MGMHPMLFTESNCVCMPNFMLVAFFFLVKHQFWLICLVHKGVCHIDLLKKIPLVTLILNIWVHGSIFNPLSMNH